MDNTTTSLYASTDSGAGSSSFLKKDGDRARAARK
jgi:hypothetical protein